MQVVNLGKRIDDPLVVCLGFYGSMHKGHVEIIERAKLRAKMIKAKVAVFTFSNNHLSVLKNDSKLLYVFDERLSIYESLGVDYVITAKFDDEFRAQTGARFLSRFSDYDVQSVFCGFDYSCGKDRLNAMGVRKFFQDPPVYIVEKIAYNNQKISTSLVRDYIINNRIDEANELLSEPFFVTGRVVHGRGMGKLLGFPTINVEIPAEKLLPSGVFKGHLSIDGTNYRAIVNIGGIPSFNVDKTTFEAHIIGFQGDLYSQNVKISILKFLRPTIKFDSAQELQIQLQHDKETALND